LLRLYTITPDLETYLIRRDEWSEWRPVGTSFLWLPDGEGKRLQVGVRTHKGIEGPISDVKVRS